MTRQGYAHYENGVRNPNYQTLVKLADLYQISVDELVYNKEVPLEVVNFYETSPYHKKRNSIMIKLLKIFLLRSIYAKKINQYVQEITNSKQRYVVL